MNFWLRFFLASSSIILLSILDVWVAVLVTEQYHVAIGAVVYIVLAVVQSVILAFSPIFRPEIPEISGS